MELHSAFPWQSLLQQRLSLEREAGPFSSPGQISAVDSFILQILSASPAWHCSRC